MLLTFSLGSVVQVGLFVCIIMLNYVGSRLSWVITFLAFPSPNNFESLGNIHFVLVACFLSGISVR